MAYFAEIGPGNVVLRVTVGDDIQWCIETLGGWWVETFQHIAGERFASAGDVYEPSDPRKFLKPGEVNP